MTTNMEMAPKGLLFDYGGTLVDEVSVDPRAGHQWLLTRASHVPGHVTLDDVLDRAARVGKEVAERRDEVQLETAWPTLTRLVYDVLGIRFADPMPDLELGFWKASVQTRAMPGAREALDEFHTCGVPLAVVSNTSFGEPVIRYELAKHRLTEHLAFVLVSSEYSVRKPNILLFETAAARLNVPAADIWFVGDRLDTDVAGARTAGMTAVWFNPTGSSSTSPDVDLMVTSWSDFASQVSSRSAGVNNRSGQSY